MNNRAVDWRWLGLVLAALVLAIVLIGASPSGDARAEGPLVDPNQAVSNLGETFSAPATEKTMLESFSGNPNALVAPEMQLPFESGRMPLEVMPSSVIGPDGRVRVTNTKAYPFRAIVLLEVSHSDGGEYMCTGWMIGPRTVATAGHCVYDYETGTGWATNIIAYPGRNANTAPYGSSTAHVMWTTNGYMTSGAAEYDYGAVQLDNTLGNTVGWFGLAVRTNSQLVNHSVTIAGYPADKKYATMWKMAGPIVAAKPLRLFYKMDTYGGQSGSPIYLLLNKKCCYGVGIHAYGASLQDRRNSGTRITQDVFNNLVSWINAAYP